MFEEVRTVQAMKILDSRIIGFSQLRLLPKKGGVRPIMNLRRRVAKLKSGKPVLEKGINKVMEPVFNMLHYEKKKQPDRIGSSLFSVGEMYPKLKTFRRHLQSINALPKIFYFIKGDVQSCFDTIPQRLVVRLIKDIATEDEYKIARHAEIKSSTTQGYHFRNSKHLRPARKFVASALATTDYQTFRQKTENGFAVGKKNTVFVDSVVHTSRKRHMLLNLLEEHVERNIVKIGKKFFRQKAGIPQGSVLSSLLCNYFYAELEKECLGFLNPDESILLRLIDDFLLITSNREHAERFSQIMHNGVEKYGVKFNPTKSLVNFEILTNGNQIPQFTGRTGFPYCGNMINTRTLEITKDRDRRRNTGRLISRKNSCMIAADNEKPWQML